MAWNQVGVPVAKSEAMAETTAAGLVKAISLSEVGRALKTAREAERLRMD